MDRAYPQLARLKATATRDLVRLVLPPACLACDAVLADDGALCPECWRGLSLIEQPFCPRLALPFPYDVGPGAVSPESIATPPPFERMRAVAIFDATARRLVHRLKYRDRLDLARWMAGWMNRAGGELVGEADFILPVPMHRRRLWDRRYNQSAALALPLARLADRPFAPALLARIRATETQVGRNRRQRVLNLRGAFQVPEAMRPGLAGKRVLLVDDVLTSGATAAAATRALRRAGAAAVDVLVFARVVRDGVSPLYNPGSGALPPA